MLARTLALAAGLALAAAAAPAATVTGMGTFGIETIELDNAGFGPGDLPFGVGDPATVTYSYDDAFTPTPLIGTSTGLDYTGGASAFSITIESSETTEVSFASRNGVITLATTDDEPTGTPIFNDSIFLVGTDPNESGPGFPGGADVLAGSVIFSESAASPTLVEGAPPTGAFTNFDFASVSFTLSDGAVVTLSQGVIIPEPASALLVGLGLAGLAAAARRRS